MNIIATKKLYTTADGLTLVEENDPKRAFLFAVPGQRVDPKRLARVKNAKDYFDKEIAAAIKSNMTELESKASELTGESHKRVEPEAQPAKGRSPTVKGHG